MLLCVPQDRTSPALWVPVGEPRRPAAGVGRCPRTRARKRARCSAAISPAGWHAARTTPRPPPPITARLCSTIPSNEVLIEFAFQMEASEGNWPQVESTGARTGQGAALAPARLAHSWVLSTSRRAAITEAEEHFKEASGHPDRRADQHAGAGLDLSGAEQDVRKRSALLDAPEAARLGHLFPALSSRPGCRRGWSHRGRTRRLRAHFQERPAHAAHRARLRPPRWPSGRHKAGANHHQRSFRAGQEARGILTRVPCSAQIEAGKRPRRCWSPRPREGCRRSSTGSARPSRARAASASASSSCSSRSTWRRTRMFPLVTLASAQETDQTLRSGHRQPTTASPRARRSRSMSRYARR